jgi:valyl-tRNA synthetase
MAAERARVDKELAKVAAELEGVRQRLANPSFVAKAPPEVVDEARARAEELEGKRRKLEAHRALVGGEEEAGPGADLGSRIHAEAERTARAGAAETRQAEAAADRLREDLARQSQPMGPAYMEMGVVEGTPGPSRRAGAGEAPRPGTGARPGKPAKARKAAKPRKVAKATKAAGKKPAGRKAAGGKAGGKVTRPRQGPGAKRAARKKRPARRAARAVRRR